MTGINIRTEGRAARITLARPSALNALTWEMISAIDTALRAWATEDAVDLLVIDAEGARAFCAGGDLSEMHATGTAGDLDYGRRFWRAEYRMNARLFDFPKPVVTFLQGYTMGGGVGVGCHGSHRIVGDTSRIAMPECAVGLVPDVGGSLLLARAPGRLGEYLGTTGARMGAGAAIQAGFADYYLPETAWPGLKADLVATGDWEAVDRAALPPPASPLPIPDIERHFAGQTFGDILRSLRSEDSAFATDTLSALAKGSPLAMACTVEMVHRLRGPAATIARALELEYRFTHRAMAQGDFIEGIRAAIIDKDRAPTWRHALDGVDPGEVARMLLPLGPDALTLDQGDTP